MIRISCIAVLLAALAPQVAAQTADFKPVTDATLANPDPADWLMLNRTFDQQRFSPLDQINKGNVAQLRMAWSRGLPNGTQESSRSSITGSCTCSRLALRFRPSMQRMAT